MEKVYLVKHQIKNVFFAIIKERIILTLLSKEHKVLKKQTTKVKRQKRIVYPMYLKKKPPPFKTQ